MPKGGEIMDYNEILRQLALKENVSVAEIEKEMKAAIESAKINCSVKEFIETVSALVKSKTTYT